METSVEEREALQALLAMYAAALGLIDEALVACEARMVRTAVQKSLHVIQDVTKIDRELMRLRVPVL